MEYSVLPCAKENTANQKPGKLVYSAVQRAVFSLSRHYLRAVLILASFYEILKISSDTFQLLRTSANSSSDHLRKFSDSFRTLPKIFRKFKKPLNLLKKCFASFPKIFKNRKLIKNGIEPFPNISELFRRFP